jgi:hypothetical protein
VAPCRRIDGAKLSNLRPCEGESTAGFPTNNQWRREMTLKSQLEEMTIQRNYHEGISNHLRQEIISRDKRIIAQGNELEDKIKKIKDQAEQIHWLKQMNQTLTRKIPNYAGA